MSGLDVNRRFCSISERLAKLPDAVFQYRVAHVRAWPNRLEDLLLGTNCPAFSTSNFNTANGFGRSEIARVPCHKHWLVRSSQNGPNEMWLLGCITKTSCEQAAVDDSSDFYSRNTALPMNMDDSTNIPITIRANAPRLII